MEGLGSLLLFAALFYFMMRFGCGAHMVHGHGGGRGEHAVMAATAGMSEARPPGIRCAGWTWRPAKAT